MRMKKLKKTISNMLSFIFFLCIISTVIGCVISKKVYSGEVSDHFNGKKFINTNGSDVNGLKEEFKFIRTRKPKNGLKIMKRILERHSLRIIIQTVSN